jgi:hypothetical protein
MYSQLAAPLPVRESKVGPEGGLWGMLDIKNICGLPQGHNMWTNSMSEVLKFYGTVKREK